MQETGNREEGTGRRESSPAAMLAYVLWALFAIVIGAAAYAHHAIQAGR